MIEKKNLNLFSLIFLLIFLSVVYFSSFPNQFHHHSRDNVGIGHLHSRYEGQSNAHHLLIECICFVQVLISRNYRGDIEMNVIEKFMQLLLEKEDESQLSPIFQHGDVAFVYIKYNNVYRR